MTEKDVEAEFDLYDTLSIHRDASAEEVRSAFRDLSRLYHPDKHSGGASGVPPGGSAAEAAFMRVHHAYRVLGDEVLRSFYDRYGLAGVRLTENLSDDEDEAHVNNDGQHLSLPEDRLKDLEGRVRSLMLKRKELRMQRLLALQGSFTLAAAAAPGPHGAHLRRRYRLQYTATSHSVQIAVCEQLKITVGCASHVQGSNGMGAAKLILAAALQLSSLTTLRTALNVTGAYPEVEFSLVRSISDHCTVQQKASLSSEGHSMALSVFPWLSRTMRGHLAISCGENPSCSVGLLKRSSSSGHSIRGFVNLQPGAGDVGAQLKYKPSKDFSMKLAPSLSHRGWTMQVTCTKVLDASALTKLHWILRVRRRSVQVRLTLCRTGLRFSLPLDLWPESAGPLPLGELAILTAFWVAPPMVLNLLQTLGRGVYRAVQARRPKSSEAASKGQQEAPGSSGEPGGDPGQAEQVHSVGLHSHQAVMATAREQRQLVEREAARRRSSEVAQRGLEVTSAMYGDPAHVASPGAAAAPGVIDVTDCLMARVRQSRLHISGAPKSSLLGFCNPVPGRTGRSPLLHIRYRFGGIEYARTFGDTDVVVLP